MQRREFIRNLAVAPVVGLRLTSLQEAVSGEALTSKGSLEVGYRKQLLVDNHLIAETSNVNRELGEVVKENNAQPILVADKVWEDPYWFGFFVTVIHDGAKFRMWYRALPTHMGYAESNDGMSWRKPVIGIHDFDFAKIRQAFDKYEGTDPLEFSGKQNNLLTFASGGLIPYLDPHETDPAHQYKGAYIHNGAFKDPFNLSKVCLAHSADGINWQAYNKGEPVSYRASDCMNQILWDEGASVYRLYTREDFGLPGHSGQLPQWTEIRGCRGMSNPDVKANPTNWTTIRKWRFDREGPQEHKRRQIMSMNSWIYEGVHFAILNVYEWPEDLSEGPYDFHKRHERDVINFYIATCRGDEVWDLSWVYAGKPMVPRGPDGSFDKDWVWPTANIVTYEDRHWLYYTGNRERHWMLDPGPTPASRIGIGVATMRLDGFVSLQAKGTGGMVTTKPFRLEGKTLEVNVEAPKGELQCEVLDEFYRPLPDFSGRNSLVYSSVDTVRLQPRWKRATNLSALRGKTVRLKFNLSNTKLYAFQIRP
jgi:hypothetical protein